MSELHENQEDTPTQSLIGHTLRNGSYTIQRILGHGGMGKVYLAKHTALNIPLALKQSAADYPLPEEVAIELNNILQGNDSVQSNAGNDGIFPSSGGKHTDRFLREALLLARSEHPSIPMLYDYFAEDGYWYLVMDYVPGPTLNTYLRQHAPIAPLEALNYALQLCDVLDYLHRKDPPVIFRDLKPSNIILAPDGALMLIDFGISRYFRSGQTNNTTDFGSPGYASPEQYLCEGQTDVRSDLYSLGVIMHEMLTGKRPKGGGTPLTPPKHYNPNLSSALSGLVTLATRIEPMYRIQSAQAFYQALERIYAIEERRTYRQNTAKEVAITGQEAVLPVSLNHLTRPTTGNLNHESTTTGPFLKDVAPSTSTAEFEAIPSQGTWTSHLDQRRQIRQTMQRENKELQSKKYLEQQMASFDESLQKRTFTPIATPVKQPVGEPTKNKFSKQKIPCALQASFMLALAIFLVMASLLISVRYFNTDNPLLGNQGNTATATVVPSGSWQVLPSLPNPQADNTAVYTMVQGHPYIYMSGGYRSKHQTPDYDRGLYRYDLLTAHWESVNVPHFPGMLNNAAATDDQGNIFFTAGYSTDTYNVLSELYEYNPTQQRLNTITSPAHIAFGFGNSMLADGQGHLYITQGFMKGGHPQEQAGTGWYRYDIVTKNWHQLAPLPVGLGYTVLTTDNAGAILLFGGAYDAGQQKRAAQIYRYDIANDSWELMTATAPGPLSGASSCPLQQGKLVVIGGEPGNATNQAGQAWLVNLYTLHWQALTPPPFGNSMLGNAVCDGEGHAFVERGADTTNRPTQDFWELTADNVQ